MGVAQAETSGQGASIRAEEGSGEWSRSGSGSGSWSEAGSDAGDSSGAPGCWGGGDCSKEDSGEGGTVGGSRAVNHHQAVSFKICFSMLLAMGHINSPPCHLAKICVVSLRLPQFLFVKCLEFCFSKRCFSTANGASTEQKVGVARTGASMQSV